MRPRTTRPSVALALLAATPPSLVVSGFLPGTLPDPYTAGVVAVAYLDADADGAYDASSETLLPGWEMFLDSSAGERASVRAQRVSWIDAEVATVEAVPPTGFELTTPAVQTVTLEAGRVTTVRFGARAAGAVTSHVTG
jgi:hypothetical protein